MDGYYEYGLIWNLWGIQMDNNVSRVSEREHYAFNGCIDYNQWCTMLCIHRTTLHETSIFCLSASNFDVLPWKEKWLTKSKMPLFLIIAEIKTAPWLELAAECRPTAGNSKSAVHNALCAFAFNEFIYSLHRMVAIVRKMVWQCFRRTNFRLSMKKYWFLQKFIFLVLFDFLIFQTFSEGFKHKNCCDSLK